MMSQRLAMKHYNRGAIITDEPGLYIDEWEIGTGIEEIF